MVTEASNVESSDDTLVTPPPKKRKVSAEDSLLKMACKKLASSDETSFVAKGWADQYEELSKEQKAFTRTIISDVLFHGYLYKLTENSVEDIHKVLKGDLSQTETPHFGEYMFSPQSCASSNQYLDQPLFSPEQTQTFICTNKRQHIIASDPPSSIAQFIENFADEDISRY